MPYFAWQGINLQGEIKKGKQSARSLPDLDAHLFKRDIALLRAKEIRYSPFMRMHGTKLTLDFFQQLAVLLSSGVLLPQALTLIALHHKHPQFQDILFSIVDHIYQGSSLSDALQRYPLLFDTMAIHMIRVGQEIGSLGNTLSLLVAYQSQAADFRKQLRAVALVPIITLIFFLCCAFGIFFIILPRFESLFTMMHHQLPPLTEKLLAFSNFLHSMYAIFVFIVVSAVIFCIAIYMRSESAKKYIDYYSLKIPIIGSLLYYRIVSQWLRSLALLLKGGVQLVPALKIAPHGIKNAVIHQACADLIDRVRAGNSLSAAMMHHENRFFEDEITALIAIGEESAALDRMLAQAADMYQAKVQRILLLITTLFQPLCMIIMGLLITALIFAVYLPIFNLAQIIG